jgi:eukaryotic-like serine/threonine-protein kinase
MSADLPDRVGPYRVTELLGQAAQATVYRAVDPATGDPVAVKLLPSRLAEDRGAAERFRATADDLARRGHPNLVRVLGHGVADHGRPYLVMELVEGATLDRLLARRRLSVPESIAVLKGVCRGLAHAHQHGLLHLGLTPRNVLVSPDLTVVKVSDLATGRFEAAPGLTGTLHTGEITLRALQYLAPEQLEGQPADHRADVYSAGALFFEMLTGRSPGPRFGLPSQLNPDLPPEADVLVLKCLARNPRERHATALDLLADLERLEETLRVRLLSELKGISRAGRRPPALLLAGLALLALLLLLAFVLTR